MPASPLLLIVGMHRSGTSLLGSLLPACGIGMPGPLIPGDTHNPEGYFERADITTLQEQLLIDLERWWPSPRGLQPLPEHWLESATGQHALAELMALLATERDRQSGPWAIKDPRSSRLLPLWQAACRQLDIPLQLLLAVRDPAEVCVSLVRRDQAATGMDGWRAQRLWWQHNAEVLQQGQTLPLRVISYGHWFDPSTALQQLRGLAPSCSDAQLQAALQAVRPEHRRSGQQAPPTPLAPQVVALHRRLEQLALNPASHLPQARHQLERWLARQRPLPAEAPLPKHRSQIKRLLQLRLSRRSRGDHPWGPLAEAFCGSAGPAAEHRLRHWQIHGFSTAELAQLTAWPAALPAATTEPWCAAAGPVAVQVRGASLGEWPAHAWLQHLPLKPPPSAPLQLQAVPLGQPGAAPLALNLADPLPGAAGAAELLHLSELERVWDPCPQRVQQLRQFGINAFWLQPQHTGNGYLEPSADRWSRCSRQLGLSAPECLRGLGTSLCLGFSSAELDQQLKPPLLGVPGFDGLLDGCSAQAQLLAQWLQGCLNAGLELVRAQPSPAEQAGLGWQALVPPAGNDRALILLLHTPIGPSELLEELAWYRQGCPEPLPCSTPSPEHRVLLERGQGAGPGGIAVCISLYNYGARILEALESVRAQSTDQPIELIVVDDASTDHGPASVQAWMEQHHSCFRRCLLLLHTSNGGLAAARNTAFKAATSPWCFVLDADNQLEPHALTQAVHLTAEADPRCAVVHGLVQVQTEPGSQDPRHLVSDLPWQQRLFRQGNYIDAMALVRQKAWQAVGGYTHIPGGWEDFDFWCCLIDAGWHGVLCPQVLATYTSHNDSMRGVSTTRQERRLSRLLQQRHPWLSLPQAQDQAIHPNAPAAAARPGGNPAAPG